MDCELTKFTEFDGDNVTDEKQGNGREPQGKLMYFHIDDLIEKTTEAWKMLDLFSRLSV